MTAGRLALVGSGEYLPVMHAVEAWLLESRPPRYLQLATAAAPEGDESLRHWHELGRQAAERLGVEQIVIDVRTREDADNPEWAKLVRGAGLIYLSGGDPSFLAESLTGTRVWDAIYAEWLAGASLAGCSAGAIALAGRVPEFRHPHRDATPGLGVLPGLQVLPHFDRLGSWLPPAVLRWVLSGPDVIGIDEETALVGVPALDSRWTFQVMGRQSAWTVASRARVRIENSVELNVDLH